MTSCWKYLDHWLNIYEGLTLWSFVPLRPTLIYTTSKWNNLNNLLESNQCIGFDMFNHKNWYPFHDLPQSWGGIKSICPFWISSTWNFRSYPSTRFSINELLSNKYDTHKSTINKISLEKRTWSWIHIKHTKNYKEKYSVNI